MQLEGNVRYQKRDGSKSDNPAFPMPTEDVDTMGCAQ